MALRNTGRSTASAKLPFGDVKATGEAISAAMRDPECDPATLALLIRDAAEAACTIKPNSEWNPTMGFKHWFGFKTQLRNGEVRFSKGVYDAYNKLSAYVASGFKDGATSYAPNTQFSGDYLDAEKTFAELESEGTIRFTKWHLLARPESQITKGSKVDTLAAAI